MASTRIPREDPFFVKIFTLILDTGRLENITLAAMISKNIYGVVINDDKTVEIQFGDKWSDGDDLLDKDGE